MPLQGRIVHALTPPLPISPKSSGTIATQSVITVGGSVIVSNSALPTGAATSAAQATLLTELQAKADLTETQPVSFSDSPVPGLSIPPHDYASLSYTGSDLTGVVYKIGGSGGTTVATLTIAYSSGNISSVTKT